MPQKSPVALKLIAIVAIVVGGYSVVHGLVSSSLVDVLVGAASVASGIGLLLRQKWGWYLAVVVSLVSLAANLTALAFFGAFMREFLAKMDASFRAVYLTLVAGPYLYCGFVVYYLLRRRTRALFGIGAPRQ